MTMRQSILFTVLWVTISCLSMACDRGGGSNSGNTSGNSGGKIKLGFLVKQPEEPWFQLEWKFADQAAQKDGFELIKIGTPDGERVLREIDNLATNGAQGFVICTPDV